MAKNRSKTSFFCSIERFF